jgi:hypothetical protein
MPLEAKIVSKPTEPGVKYLQLLMPMSSDPQPSGSGKTLIVAGTNGLFATDLLVNGGKVKISASAFIPNPNKPE